jgi:hypothetical protein
LTLVAKGGCNNALGGGIQISRLVHDHRILAAHLQDGALDPHLPRLRPGRPLVNAQSYLLGAGESDEAGLGMIDQGIAHPAARTRQEIAHPIGQTGLAQNFDVFPGDLGRDAGRFQHHRVAHDDGRAAHPHRDSQREIPRRDDGASIHRRDDPSGLGHPGLF